MLRFKSEAQVQRFLAVHAAIHNSFRLARHGLKAIHHRLLSADRVGPLIVGEE